MFDFNDDFDVDFNRLVSDLESSIVDEYDLVEPDRFIPLEDWLVSDKGKQYLDNIDMLDKEIDKALSEGEI